ncbi:MAG: BtpA/SgcQ family protein [Alphaproteobacteria bacterium]|nr:BtpA/SgcQ family protein [Alphaproteobacteria bacterium]
MELRRPARGGVHLVGVIHLPPLPGAPRTGPGMDAVIARAVADARTLQEAGAHGAIVENLGDAPFAATQVEPVTVAALTAVALAVRAAAPGLALGVNVLRNDALAALGIAAVVDAAFVRVNVWTGVMATDQGLVTGSAREALQLRQRLGTATPVLADVLVKHASPLGTPDLADVARDTWHRGGAAGLIVSGTGTGRPTRPEDVARVREAVPDAPLWLGSGLTPDGVPAVAPWLDGAIVGTWLHRDGDLDAPLDANRVRTLHAALDAVPAA